MTGLGELDKPSWTKNIVGIVMILAALGALGVFGYFRIMLGNETELTTELCPANGPTGHLAILLDTTDPLEETHVLRTRQIVRKMIDDVPVGTRISFSTVSPDSDVRQSAFFTICKPLSRHEVSQLNKNPELVQEQFNEKFAIPVETALDSLLTIPTAPNSPIMEGLQEFASRIPDFTTTTDRPRELVLMSDLMQHSEVFSFYEGGTWKSFVEANLTERFGLAISGSKFTILRIPRIVEMAAIVDDFWARYLMFQGIDEVRIERIGDL